MNVLSYLPIPDELQHRMMSTVDTGTQFLHSKCKNNKFDLAAEHTDDNDDDASRERENE